MKFFTIFEAPPTWSLSKWEIIRRSKELIFLFIINTLKFSWYRLAKITGVKTIEYTFKHKITDDKSYDYNQKYSRR